MKTEAIKRLINAVDVWVACGVFDGTNFNPNTDDAKTEVEQLALHNVVGQSEQLKAEGRKEATEEIRCWLIEMDYEGLAESL